MNDRAGPFAGATWTGPRGEAFASLLAHELRTPLNGIRSWAHVLEGQLPDDPLARRALDGVMAGVDQQVRLLEQLTDLARAHQGELEMATIPCSLQELLASCVERVRPVATERELQLDVKDLPAGCRVHADAVRLGDALSSLLEHAVRATPSGGRITVAAQWLGTFARIEVRDGARAGTHDASLAGLLARAVILLHHGSLVREPGAAGGVARVELPTLPA